jgi:ABC-2 type transport system ATP-binding protein
MSDVMIEARNLTKTYGSVQALKGATFEVRRGEVLGFIGPNGAGKTTTMKILTCFIAPTSGTAKVNGCDVWEDPIGVRRAIGYLPESTPLYAEMLVIEYLEFMAKMRGLKGNELDKHVKKAIEQTNLGGRRGQEIGSLSKGYKQRVGLAQALVHEPAVLILDEPMSGLDPNQAADMREVITNIGRERTVIYSTHNLAEVQITCDRVLVIADGGIVADDTPKGLSDRYAEGRMLATVEVTGESISKVRDALTKIAGVKSVKEHVGETPETTVYDVLPEGQKDLRADVVRATAEAGFTLVGIEKKRADLESVFRQLTTGTSKQVS